ncbi:GNAT family N-acetyltransferase [Photobacterium chitinilyticum]|uniref:GNAT family N-acetyltransferase n=1 Tax=Photobacterium chitinilyticum TaxID=2485123 RepID=UPI003D12EC80
MIREAKPEDCVDLAVLSLQVWLHTYATKGIREKISRFALNTFTEKYFLDLLNRSENKVQVYIKDEHLIGFVVIDLASKCSAENAGYEIKTLYISEHFQGSGIGRQLLSQIESQYGSPFWLSTWENNINAIGFYQKLGFKILENTPLCQGSCHC